MTTLSRLIREWVAKEKAGTHLPDSTGTSLQPRQGRSLKPFFVAVIGVTVVLIAIVMIVLPGSVVVVIAASMAILETEFFGASRAWRQCKGVAAKVRRKSGLVSWLRRAPLRLKPQPFSPQN